MNLIDLVLGILAILLTVWITWRQHIQLRKLKQIGEETRTTAQKLKADTRTQEIVKTFFALRESRDARYKCVFPVYYDRRPLPFIVAGDYHALHVLQELMGPASIELKPVPQKAGGSAGESPHRDLVDGNIVYLCTPSVNPVLESLAPAVELGARDRVGVPKFSEIELPCWFAVEVTGTAEGPRSVKKKIWVPGLDQRLESGAESDYDRAARLQSLEVYKPESVHQSDYAILLRLSQGNRKVIVMAGIHQYGTWIVAEFFRMLTLDVPLRGKEIFESSDDFLAVIWGEFDSTQFRVHRCDVARDYLWVRRGQTWERIGAKTAEAVVR